MPITHENEKFCEKKNFSNIFFIFLCGKTSENVRKSWKLKSWKNCGLIGYIYVEPVLFQFVSKPVLCQFVSKPVLCQFVQQTMSTLDQAGLSTGSSRPRQTENRNVGE